MVSTTRSSKTISRITNIAGFLEKPALFVALISIGLAVRLILLAYTTASTDLEIYGHVAYDGTIGVPLYQNYMFSYPMLWGYVFRIAGLVCHLFGTRVYSDFPMLAPYSFPGLYTSIYTHPLATVLFKIPSVIADAGTAYVVYSFVRQSGGSSAQSRAASVLWWANPIVIWVGSVQSGWDSFVALTIVGSILLASRRNWLGSGVLVGLGVCAKLVPLFVAVPLAVYIIKSARSVSGALRDGVLVGVGFSLAVALSILPILSWHEIGALKFAVFARVGQFLIQGLNLGQFAWITQFTWIFGWEEYHRTAIVAVLSRAQSVLIMASIIIALFIKRFTDVTACLLAVTLYLIVFVLSPYIQPNYFLWILPLLAILGVLQDRRYYLFGLAMSGITFGFIVVVRAWQAIVEPACIFLHVCDPVSFARAALSYTALTPGFFSMSHQVDADSVLGEIGGVLFITMLVFCFVKLFRLAFVASREGPVAETRAVITLRARYGGTCLTILALAIVVSLQFVVPPLPSLAADPSGHSDVRPIRYIGDVTVLRNPLRPPRINDAFLYDDDRFLRGRGGSRAFAASFRVHFEDEEKRRANSVRLHVIDADELRAVLKGPTQGRAVLVMEGFLPETVRSTRSDLLKLWLKRGGVVMWAGAPFDVFYSARTTSHPPILKGPDYGPWTKLYDGDSAILKKMPDPWSPPLGIGTKLAGLWGINRLNFSRTTFPVVEAALRKGGGAPLGYISDEGYSSISQIPIGRGSLIFFGDSAWNEIDAAHAVAQILYTGSYFDPLKIQSTYLQEQNLKTVVPPKGRATLIVYGVPPAFYDFPVQQ